MPKANNTDIYKYNEYPSLLDYLFGSDFEDYKKNKSFRLNSIIQLINNVNGINNTQYIFSDGSDPEIDYFDKGYFFTDNNETDPNSFTKIILNKESLQPIDLTLLFERLATINSLVLRLDNPSDPNNFFNFNITSIADEGNFFVFDVEPFENFFFGELINSTVYSVYFDVKANISNKLDRGGYTGTAKDLNDRINSVQFPNEILINGPVLLENGTVSISANDFTVRINQNVVSNADDYNVVINPATQGFNRTDIIVINQNGEFTKIQGQESVDVAVKPVPSADTLEITSINVLGNTILSPIPSDNAKLDRAGYNGTAATLDQKIDGTREDLMTRIDDFEYEIEEIKLPLKADKLNTYTKTEVDSKINNYFKGVYLTESALIAAHPTANIGNYAQVNEVGATDVVNYNWDAEENIWVKNITEGGSSATNTDELPEGTTNLYFTLTRFLANLTYANIIAALGFTPSTAPNNAQKNSDITKAEIEAKLTGEITSHTHPNSGSDMTTNTPQSVSALKTFLNGMLGLRNVANTFTSFFTNANTASRTYTLQNRDGTLADLTDIASVNSNKMNVPTGGVANFLPRFLTATTMGISRLWDTGTKFGIGTVRTPLEDLSFGRQENRTIGVEESSNTVAGRDLIVSAGRTINYVQGAGFQREFSGLSMSFTGAIVEPISKDLYVAGNGGVFRRAFGTSVFITENPGGNAAFFRALGYDNIGNIYLAIAGGGVLKKTISTGIWSSLTTTGISGNTSSVAGNSIGDLYIATSSGLFKQTGMTGSFVQVYTGNADTIAISPIDNSVYVFNYTSSIIVKQTSGTGVFNTVANTSLARGMCCGSDGNTYAMFANNLFKQTAGVGAFTSMGVSVSGSGDWSTGLAIDSNSSLYSVHIAGPINDVFFLDNNSPGSPNLDGGTKSERAGTGKGTGKSRWDVWTGQKTASGTNMQALVKRIEVDEMGAFLLLTDHIYDNNAAAVAAGLRKGSLYWNSAGDLKIVM